jgi:hypothetical protein
MYKGLALVFCFFIATDSFSLTGKFIKDIEVKEKDVRTKSVLIDLKNTTIAGQWYSISMEGIINRKSYLNIVSVSDDSYSVDIIGVSILPGNVKRKCILQRQHYPNGATYYSGTITYVSEEGSNAKIDVKLVSVDFSRIPNMTGAIVLKTSGADEEIELGRYQKLK